MYFIHIHLLCISSIYIYYVFYPYTSIMSFIHKSIMSSIHIHQLCFRMMFFFLQFYPTASCYIKEGQFGTSIVSFKTYTSIVSFIHIHQLCLINIHPIIYYNNVMNISTTMFMNISTIITTNNNDNNIMDISNGSQAGL